MKIETKTQIMAPVRHLPFEVVSLVLRAWRVPGRRLRSAGGGGHSPQLDRRNFHRSNQRGDHHRQPVCLENLAGRRCPYRKKRRIRTRVFRKRALGRGMSGYGTTAHGLKAGIRRISDVG